jgi:hypothetical protein
MDRDIQIRGVWAIMVACPACPRLMSSCANDKDDHFANSLRALYLQISVVVFHANHDPSLP